jgi:mRNA interferase RelE/StbE
VNEPASRLVMPSSAERAQARLPEKSAAAVVELVTGALVEEPRVAGRPLRSDLMGLWAARRGLYQVAYEINDERRCQGRQRLTYRPPCRRAQIARKAL